jgi:[protein-PII] uridylyltransferase
MNNPVVQPGSGALPVGGKPDMNSIRKSIFCSPRRFDAPLDCLHDFSAAIDAIISTVFSRIGEPHRQSLCVVALGGYGRGEMWPYSDVDLMLLYREGTDLDIIRSFERNVWDLGLIIGFSARTPSECSAILGDDYITDTALLEARSICGNPAMFHRLSEEVIKPFFRRRKRAFIDEMMSTLNAGLKSSDDTLYRIEPDVKNGICGLRDCHRIRWVDIVDSVLPNRSGAGKKNLLSSEERDLLEKCYTFIAGIRTELHTTGGRRIDTLEIALQPTIASAIGFLSGGAADLMKEYFNTVTVVRHCIMSLSEKVAAKRRTIGNIRSAIASFDVGNGLRVIDGFLHASGKSSSIKKDAVWIMTVFTTAHSCNTGISAGLRNQVRDAARMLSSTDFRDQVVENGIAEILSAKTDSGRIVDLMHDTGVLGLVIPEFQPLTCRVEFDSYHEYTVDQHSLMALRALDDADKDDDRMVREVFSRMKNLRVLRLALLLHDAGKAIPGDHCRSGAILIRNAASRIGFNDEEQAQAAFLIYNHLKLSELSFRRELEDFSIQQLAEKIGTPEMLDMLYLLTVLDIRHVGSKTWTGWKSMQLEEIHSRIRSILLNGPSDNWKNRLINETDEYIAATIPEDRPLHEQWLKELGGKSIHLHTEKFTGFYRVSVVTRDRISLLADIAACFVSAGLNILSARINSFSGAGIVDVFDVEPDPVIVLGIDERMERFKASWDRLISGEVVSNEIVEARIKHYPRKPLRRIDTDPSVTFNVKDSPDRTIIEIQAPDRFGLFYTIVNAIGSKRININAARIATSADEAADVFYVTDATNDKITDPGVLEDLKKTLMAVLS